MKFHDLILDIDSTLIHTITDTADIAPNNITLAHFRALPSYWTFLRPHLHEFLDYIFEHYRVSVWTAADAGYAYKILEHIMPKRQIYAFYTRISTDECEDKTGKHKLLTYFDKIFDKPLIIDDRVDVAAIQPNNAYNIKAFDVTRPDAYLDTALVDLVRWLQVIDKPDLPLDSTSTSS